MALRRALVCGVRGVTPSALRPELSSSLALLPGWHGHRGEMELVLSQNEAICCVGLEPKSKDAYEEEESEADVVRAGVARAVRSLWKRDLDVITVDTMGHAQAAAEGAVLAAPGYAMRSKAAKPVPRIEPTEDSAAWQRGLVMAQHELQARHWADQPANVLNADAFCAAARALFASRPHCSVHVRDADWLREQRMEGILTVNRGSANAPRLLEVHYRPDGVDAAPRVVLVGKGVTFDSGGISIKGAANMHLMKGDMGGGAAVVAALGALAALDVRVPVTVLVPLVENMPSATACRPGDVYTAANGKTIEVINTDAEGRLILAEALHYASQMAGAEFIVDVATLTGAVSVALGDAAFACFTPSDAAWSALHDATQRSGQPAWRLPMYRRYRELMRSDVADMANANTSGQAGSGTAAAFLREFVSGSAHWLHLDIAGVMHAKAAAGVLSHGMTGIPTRTLVEFVAALQRKD